MGVTTVLLDEEILWRVFLYEYLSVQLIDKSGGCDVRGTVIRSFDESRMSFNKNIK